MNTREHGRNHAPERSPAHETVSNNDAKIALTTRFLLGGEQLNPERVIPQVEEANLRLNDGTTSLISRASNHNRDAFWENRPEQTFDEQLSAWKLQTTTAISSLSTRLESDVTKRDRWQAVFTAVGIENMSEFSAEKAQSFYDSYFIGENKDSNISQFVENIARKYMPANEAVKYDDFYKDMEAISWLGNMFGEKIAHALPSLIEARLMRNDAAKRAEVATKANIETNGMKRVNQLTQEENNEKDILEYLWRFGQQPREEPAENAPTRGNNPPTEQPQGQTPENISRTMPVVIAEDNADTEHLRNIPIEHYPPPKDYNTADRLLNYTTGELTGEQVDLSNSFSQYVTSIENFLERDDTIPAGSTRIALSEVARAMIDRLASKSNEINKELAFVVHGVKVQKNGKSVLVGAYVVPAMKFSEAQLDRAYIDPQIDLDNSTSMAEKTNLKEYFRQKSGFVNGINVAVLHTHQDQFGEYFRANPSQQDYRTATNNATLTDKYPWGVITKSGNTIYTKLIHSTRDGRNPVEHNSLKFIYM